MVHKMLDICYPEGLPRVVKSGEPAWASCAVASLVRLGAGDVDQEEIVVGAPLDVRRSEAGHLLTPEEGEEGQVQDDQVPKSQEALDRGDGGIMVLACQEGRE